MTRAARVDANQRQIVEALRAAGASVQHLHKVGEGCPDLLVGFRGKNYLMEVKTLRGTLNVEQVIWHAGWRGVAYIVRDIEDALKIIERE